MFGGRSFQPGGFRGGPFQPGRGFHQPNHPFGPAIRFADPSALPFEDPFAFEDSLTQLRRDLVRDPFEPIRRAQAQAFAHPFAEPPIPNTQFSDPPVWGASDPFRRPFWEDSFPFERPSWSYDTNTTHADNSTAEEECKPSPSGAAHALGSIVVLLAIISIWIFFRRNRQQRQKRNHFYSQVVSEGAAKDVGELGMNRSVKPRSGKEPYVFLSHRGSDTKEIIARPTFWFLHEVLGIDTFFDDESMTTGEEKMRSLVEPAHQCTLPVILLSPKFRESDYCVMELNTFMSRLASRESDYFILPFLWNLENVGGFAPALNDINWRAARTDNPAKFMVETLWPCLLERLKCGKDRPDWDAYDLRKLLASYVEENRGSAVIPPIPSCLKSFADGSPIFLRTLGGRFFVEIDSHGDDESTVTMLPADHNPSSLVPRAELVGTLESSLESNQLSTLKMANVVKQEKEKIE